MRFGRFVALAEVERVMKIQEVIMKAKAGELKWYQAADILGITDRHLRRLRNRFKVDPTGLFRNRQPSPKRLKQEIVDEILRLYQTEYAGYNVTHFHEELLETHHIKVGYTCVKLLLQKHKLVPKHKKRGHYRRRRERRPLTGMLLHMDGSHHRWFEHPAHERQCLIAIIDDADSKCLAAKFFKEEGTVEVLEVLKSVVQEHGTFVSLYTDRASHFAHTPAAGGPFDPSAITQVDRVLNELGIELIRAYSPQARGRGERAWQTMQGRLPQELAKAGATTYEAANEYLQNVFIPKYNQKFTVPPKEEGTAFLPIVGFDIERVFCRRHERRVNKDNTVQYLNHILPMPKPELPGTSFASRKVEIREHLDGSIDVFAGKQLIASFPNLELLPEVVKLEEYKPDMRFNYGSGQF